MTELREPLRPDLRIAKAHLATVVAGLRQRLAVAEREASLASGKAVAAGRYPLPVDQIILRNYNERLAFDEAIRSADHRYANVGIDDRLISFLRDGLAGRLDDAMLQRLVGDRIEHFKRLGTTTAVIGTSEWRTLASAMCMSALEAMGRVVERNEGDFTGKPDHPMLANAVQRTARILKSVNLTAPRLKPSYPNRNAFSSRVGNGRTTKTKQSRKVPIHKALVDEVLLQFVEAANSGPLFIYTRAGQALRNWIREEVLKDEKENSPSPNHGFRHLFEDLRLGRFSVDAGLYITGRANPSSWRSKGLGGKPQYSHITD